MNDQERSTHPYAIETLVYDYHLHYAAGYAFIHRLCPARTLFIWRMVKCPAFIAKPYVDMAWHFFLLEHGLHS